MPTIGRAFPMWRTWNLTRPLAAFELWVWQSIFGPEYLTTWIPRMWSALWVCTPLASHFCCPGPAGVGFTLYLDFWIGLSVLLHPAFNELILWGVLANVALGTALAAAGVLLAYSGRTASQSALGVALVCAAGLCQQMLAIFGVVFVAMEIAALGWQSIQREGSFGWIWRACLMVFPVIVGIAVLLVMRNGLGYEDFASRSLGIPDGLFRAKFFVLTNSYANVFQAPLGWAIGNSIALRAFWPAMVVPVVIIFLALRLTDTNVAKSILLAALPISVFWLAMSPLLGTNATPTGFRVMGPALIAMSIALAIALTPLWRSLAARTVLVLVIASIATANLGSTIVDTSARSVALKRDQGWLATTKAQILERGAPQVQLCSWKFEPRAESINAAPGILVSYNVAGPDQYSEWYSPFLAHYLVANGIDAKVPKFGESSDFCAGKCEGNEDFILGPLRGRFHGLPEIRFVCGDRVVR